MGFLCVGHWTRTKRRSRQPAAGGARILFPEIPWLELMRAGIDPRSNALGAPKRKEAE